MKLLRLSYLLVLCFGLLVYTGCGGDDDGGAADRRADLNYDGDNATAPNSNFTSFAAFFPANRVSQFEGRTLETVEVHLAAVPLRTSVVIYGAGPDDSAPDESNELYRQDITQRINVVGDFYEHRLARNVTLGTEGIWIAIEVELEGFVPSVGCDAGANYNPNGDRVEVDGVWTSFNQVTGSERINWNIRGFVSAN